MPFDLTNNINKIPKFTCNNKVLYKLMQNPIYVTLLLTTLIMIIIVFILGEDLDYTPKEYFRVGFNILLISGIVVGIHHYAYVKLMETEQVKGGMKQIYNGIANIRDNPNYESFPVLNNEIRIPGSSNNAMNLGKTITNENILSSNDNLVSGGYPSTKTDSIDEELDSNYSDEFSGDITNTDNIENIQLENVELNI